MNILKNKTAGYTLAFYSKAVMYNYAFEDGLIMWRYEVFNKF